MLMAMVLLSVVAWPICVNAEYGLLWAGWQILIAVFAMIQRAGRQKHRKIFGAAGLVIDTALTVIVC